NLGDGGNTFTVVSTHGTDTLDKKTFVSTGAGNDTVYVDTIGGDTTIDTGTGTDDFYVGSSTGAPPSDPTLLSHLNEIRNGTRTLTGGGENDQHLFVYDTHDTGQNIGVLPPTKLTGLGMTLGIVYSGIKFIDVQLSNGNDHFTIASTPVGSVLTVH